MNDEFLLSDLKHHPRVCSTCFRFRHHADPVPELIQAKAAAGVLWAQAVTESWTRTTLADSAAPPGESISEWKQTTVCECGAVSAYADVHRDGALDMATMIEYGDHLTDTLSALAQEHRERGNPVRAAAFAADDDTFFDVLRCLKRKPEHQFKDDKIFAVALRLAKDEAQSDDTHAPVPESEAV